MEFTSETCQPVSYYVQQSVSGTSCSEILQVYATYMLLPLTSLSIQPSFEMPQVMSILNILIERMGPVTGKRYPNWFVQIIFPSSALCDP